MPGFEKVGIIWLLFLAWVSVESCTGSCVWCQFEFVGCYCWKNVFVYLNDFWYLICYCLNLTKFTYFVWKEMKWHFQWIVLLLMQVYFGLDCLQFDHYCWVEFSFCLFIVFVWLLTCHWHDSIVIAIFGYHHHPKKQQELIPSLNTWILFVTHLILHNNMCMHKQTSKGIQIEWFCNHTNLHHHLNCFLNIKVKKNGTHNLFNIECRKVAKAMVELTLHFFPSLSLFLYANITNVNYCNVIIVALPWLLGNRFFNHFCTSILKVIVNVRGLYSMFVGNDDIELASSHFSR